MEARERLHDMTKLKRTQTHLEMEIAAELLT